MGLLFVQGIPGPKVFACKCCKVDNASHDAVLSKNFSGRHGPAYLISHVVNITVGPSEDRHLLTGWHIVNDVYCSSCQQLLGWKYEKAYDDTQKYKEGNFVLEKARLTKRPYHSTSHGRAEVGIATGQRTIHTDMLTSLPHSRKYLPPP